MFELDSLLDDLSKNKQEIVSIEKQLNLLKPNINLLEENINSILQEEKIFNNNISDLDDRLFSKTYLRDKKNERRSFVSVYWRDPSTKTGFKEELTKFDLLHLKHYKENRMIMQRDLDILNSRWNEYKIKKNEEEKENFLLDYDYIINNKEYRLIPPSSKSYQYVEEYIRNQHTYLKLIKELEEKYIRDKQITQDILSLKKVTEN